MWIICVYDKKNLCKHRQKLIKNCNNLNHNKTSININKWTLIDIENYFINVLVLVKSHNQSLSKNKLQRYDQILIYYVEFKFSILSNWIIQIKILELLIICKNSLSYMNFKFYIK